MALVVAVSAFVIGEGGVILWREQIFVEKVTRCLHIVLSIPKQIYLPKREIIIGWPKGIIM